MLAAAGSHPRLKQLHSLADSLLCILLLGHPPLQAAVVQHMRLALALALVAALHQQQLSVAVLQLAHCRVVCLELLQLLHAQVPCLVALLLLLEVVVQRSAAEPL